MSTLTVHLGENSYDIIAGSGLLPMLGRSCADRGLKGSVAIITNPVVSALYGEAARRSLETAGNTVTMIEIPDGEEFKNAQTLASVYDALIDAGLDRKSFIVALGGGVVGDLAGFAAATYLRGIPFVQVPTTLLAQVDSSVGGKTAIDHPRGKNLIGAFYQPALVLIDIQTLNTLDDRQYHAGLAEVIKYGVSLDAAFFEFLEQNSRQILEKEREAVERMILHCCRIKAEVVELDEKENGIRAVLNYGHTLGHALETLSGYSQMVHGEAVAIGMALAARISENRGFSTVADRSRITALITTFGLSVDTPPVEREKLLTAVMTDKKSRAGTISFICNRGVGGYAVEKMTPDQLLTESGIFGAAEASAASPQAAPNQAWNSALPVADSLDADFHSFDADDEEEEIIEDLEILDIDEADLLEVDEDEEEENATFSAADAMQASGADPLVTATVAELYVQQGLSDKALEIYHALALTEPDNTLYRERIQSLGGGPSADISASDPSEPVVNAIQTVVALSEADEQKIVELESWLENIRELRKCH